jgi:hypothetical protein
MHIMHARGSPGPRSAQKRDGHGANAKRKAPSSSRKDALDLHTGPRSVAARLAVASEAGRQGYGRWGQSAGLVGSGERRTAADLLAREEQRAAVCPSITWGWFVGLSRRCKTRLPHPKTTPGRGDWAWDRAPFGRGAVPPTWGPPWSRADRSTERPTGASGPHTTHKRPKTTATATATNRKKHKWCIASFARRAGVYSQRSLAPASLRSARPCRTTRQTNWSKEHVCG